MTKGVGDVWENGGRDSQHIVMNKQFFLHNFCWLLLVTMVGYYFYIAYYWLKIKGICILESRKHNILVGLTFWLENKILEPIFN